MKSKSFNFSLKRSIKESIVLLRNIPSVVVALFVISVITMNILANKTLAINNNIIKEYIGNYDDYKSQNN